MVEETTIPGWEEISNKFVALVAKSPIAIVTFILSFFLGYGISFVLFDYRTNSTKASHYIFHLLIGLGYTAAIFLIVNHEILKDDLTEEILSKKMPLTLLISFAVAFVLILIISIVKEIRKPYKNE